MKIKIYAENEVQNEWDEVWKKDNIQRNMKKIDYPEYWSIFDKYITKDDKLLEAGCGLGKWINYFHSKGYKITGIDYSDVAINNLKAYNPNFDVCFGDITNNSFIRQQNSHLMMYVLKKK